MWVPSLPVMSGRTQGKGAKATSTDSPAKGYGTPNLVDVTGRWLVSGLCISARVSGLRSHVLSQVRVLVQRSLSLSLGHTRGPTGQGPRSVAGMEMGMLAYTISPARRAHGGHPMTPPLQD